MRYHFKLDTDEFSKPLTAEEAARTYAEVDAARLRALGPGETYFDMRGDEWSIAPKTEPALDERLERIALEYLRILLPAHLNGVRLECSVAEAAVRNAKALIAELDKQA